jgi:hypothetical protein
LQHPLLIALFQDYAITRKIILNTLTEQRAKRFIESALSKDIAFKNKMIGLVVGQFTLEEFALYSTASSEFNKRIFAMIKKRLKDSLLELGS